MGEPLNYVSRGGAMRRRMGRTVLATVITAALLTLMNSRDIGSEVFTCPTTQPTVFPGAGAEKWDFGGGGNTALNWSNWNAPTATQPADR
jgi:hypothetical protein